jgi:preprotein translocase subunit SecF
VSPRADGRRHTPADFYHERTNFDFTGRAWRWAILSGTVILIALIAIFTRGLNLGIDFEGGTSWQVPVKGKSASVTDVRDVIRPLGLSDAKVLVLKGDSGTSVRVQSKDIKPSEEDAVTDALAKYGGVQRTDVSVNTVGPTFGDQVRNNAVKALIVFFGLIALYLSIRFEWKMAGAAIVAVIHDIIITVGVYAVTGFEVTPATVVAFLTILGFSLYDTVVVFDKVKENTRGLLGLTRRTYSEAANLALNQTLMRSINTSLIAVLPVVGLMVVGVGLLGVGTLADLALVQIVGIIAGAASSVLLATPILVDLKQRDPRIREQARRVAARRARAAAAVTGAAGGSPTGDIDPSDDDALAGELRRERAMAAAAGVPSRTAPARRPAGSRERPTGKSSRPTGKRRR